VFLVVVTILSHKRTDGRTDTQTPVILYVVQCYGRTKIVQLLTYLNKRSVWAAVCGLGAQDFLPDFQRASDWYRLRRKRPRYGPLMTAMKKVKEWMHTARVSWLPKHAHWPPEASVIT